MSTTELDTTTMREPCTYCKHSHLDYACDEQIADIKQDVVKKAIDLLYPINYQPFEYAHFVTMNDSDMGNDDYCENCIGAAIKEARKLNKSQRQELTEQAAKMIAEGFYLSQKKKVQITELQVLKWKRDRLKEWPAKAKFGSERHDPDFGGGLNKPCTCEKCGRYFQCSFTPDKEQAQRMLDDVKNAGEWPDETKWTLETGLYNYAYVEDSEAQDLLYQVAETILKKYNA